MAGFHSASEYTKLGFVLMLAGGAMLFVAFMSPYWTTSDEGHSGLWQACNVDYCYDRWNQWVASWVKACQAFTTMSVVFTAGAIFFALLYIFHKDFEMDRRLVFGSMCLCFATAFCMLVTWITWAAGSYYGTGETLNWCYAFAVCSDLAIGAAGVCMLRELVIPVHDYSEKLLEIF